MKLNASNAMLACLLSTLLLSGCADQTSNRASDAKPAAITQPLPSYAVIAQKYNKRVERLDKVWARISMRVTGLDTQGEPVDEQAEGHLQVVRPDKLALSITKVGETYFYLGSNADLYWWLDLHQDPHRALVGHHDKATPAQAAKFDIPVHPLDLLELLGITPLPPGATASVAWSKDGKSVEVKVPGRWGQRRLLLDPVSYAAREIDLFDSRGKPVVSARLESPQAVAVRCDSSTPPMASLYHIDLHNSKTTIVLRLYDPENRCDRQKMTPFDLEALSSAYGIKSVEWIDPKPLSAPGAVPTATPLKPTPPPPAKPAAQGAGAGRATK